MSTVLLVLFKTRSYRVNNFGDIMASLLAKSAVNSGYEPQSRQTKENKIGSCCFSSKHAL